MIRISGRDNSQFDVKPSNPPATSQIDASTISSYSSDYYQTIFITKSGELYAAGNNENGLIYDSLPKEIVKGFTKFEIVDEDGEKVQPISAFCGEHFSLYLVASKKQEDPRLIISPETKKPFFINLPKNFKAVALFGGLRQAAVIDDKGSFVLFNFMFIDSIYNTNIKKHQLPNNEKAVKIGCGQIGFFILGESGRVYSCDSSFDYLKCVLDLKKKKEKVIDISCVHFHCLALCKNGKVFGCNSNEYGQLGIGEEKDYSSEFVEISSLKKYKIKAVYAGDYFSLFQTNEGKILACGNNSYGQLLGDNKGEEKVCLPIETDIKKDATFCCAGECISSVFINADPLMSPNRVIKTESNNDDVSIDEETEEEEAKQIQNKKFNQEAKIEIEKLKRENLLLQQKIKKLENKLYISNEFKPFDQEEINQMKKIESIGRGSQCEVFKVAQNFIVLKVLLIDSNSDSFIQLKRLIQEYEILSSLHHPNIIRTLGFCYGDKTHPPSILLQYCPYNLNKIIKDMSSIQKVCAIYEISSAMETVHKNYLIHRDLKPENILIDEEGHVRLSDFGVSCIVDKDNVNQSKTTGIGSIKFMAPELLNEETHYDNKVDVYSFGVVLFFILTGGEMPDIKLCDQTSGKKAEIPNCVNRVSKDLIKRCWQKEADDRPSFVEIVEFIQANNFNLIDGIDNQIPQIKEFLSI